MFYFINKRNILQIVLAVLLFGWAVFTIFTQMTLCPPEGQTLMYHRIFDFWNAHPLNYMVASVVWVLLEAFLIQGFFNRNKFSDMPTMMPILMFLLFLNCGRFLTCFTPAYFTMLLISVICLFNTKNSNEKPQNNTIFASGIAIGIATLFDVNALGVFFFLTLVILTNHLSKGKDFAILIAGLLLVAIYTFSYHFMSDTLPVLAESVRQLKFFFIEKNIKQLTVADFVLLSVLVLGMFYCVAKMKLYYDNKLIILRKRFATTVLLLVVLLIVMLFANYDLHQGLIYLIVPISLFFSMLSDMKKKRLVNDLVTIAVLVMLCL